MRSVPELLAALEVSSPAFAHARAEHFAFNEEVLPYVLLEDFRAQWLARHVCDDRAQVEDVLAVLEQFQIEGDDGVRNLIGVAVLEALGGNPRDRGERELRRLLGPSLRDRLSQLDAGTA